MKPAKLVVVWSDRDRSEYLPIIVNGEAVKFQGETLYSLRQTHPVWANVMPAHKESVIKKVMLEDLNALAVIKETEV